MKRRVREELLNALLIAGGLLLATLGYRLYLIPNNVAPGGFTGIGQIVNHLVPSLGVGLVNLLLNVPLFLLSLRSMGLGFGLRSLLSSVLLSLLLDYLPVPAMTDDVLLSAVFGGVLCGAGFGLVLRGHATTGGSDMLAALVHRRVPALKVSVCLFAVDATVVVASGFVFDASAAMYALISVFVMIAGGVMVTLNSAGQISPAMELPMQVYYICVPISGVLMVLYCLQRLITFTKELKEEK